jgi:hypothetical protein
MHLFFFTVSAILPSGEATYWWGATGIHACWVVALALQGGISCTVQHKQVLYCTTALRSGWLDGQQVNGTGICYSKWDLGVPIIPFRHAHACLSMCTAEST